MMEPLAAAESDEIRTMGHSVVWKMTMKCSYFLCGHFRFRKLTLIKGTLIKAFLRVLRVNKKNYP